MRWRWMIFGLGLGLGLARAEDDAEMGRRLQDELRAHGGDVHGCYGVALAETPGLAGELLVLHEHPKALELLYVVKGRAHLRGAAGGVPESAETGDVIVAPAGAAHSIEAAPLAPLQLVQVFVPPGPEHAYLDPKDRGGT